MAGANLTAVLFVIAELVVSHIAVLVAQQSVRPDDIGIEIDLDFYIAGDYLQVAGQIVHKNAMGLGDIIDIRIVAVPFVPELLH